MTALWMIVLCGVLSIIYAIWATASVLKSVPLSEAASIALAAGFVGMAEIISGGDDYEILCAIPQDALEDFVVAAQAAGVAVSPIGTFIAGDSPPKWLDAEGKELPLTRTSYSHF